MGLAARVVVDCAANGVRVLGQTVSAFGHREQRLSDRNGGAKRSFVNRGWKVVLGPTADDDVISSRLGKSAKGA